MRFGSLPATVLLSCSILCNGFSALPRIGNITTAIFTMEQDAVPREEIMVRATITEATITILR